LFQSLKQIGDLITLMHADRVQFALAIQSERSDPTVRVELEAHAVQL
jgi:hypothetical protein